MSEQPKTDAAPVPATAAVCGLFCEACTLYIATHEEPERLPALAARWGFPVERMHCDGCRSERRTPYCEACETIPAGRLTISAYRPRIALRSTRASNESARLESRPGWPRCPSGIGALRAALSTPPTT